MHFTIGELARRTGLSVRSIRFYSDAGVVPPSGRTASGYRLPGVVARLETARTLRDLGLDLATVTRILDRELTLGDVVALHADALDAAHGRRTLAAPVVRRLHDDELRGRLRAAAARAGDLAAEADALPFCSATATPARTTCWPESMLRSS